jgi:hypothetical protein
LKSMLMMSHWAISHPQSTIGRMVSHLQHSSIMTTYMWTQRRCEPREPHRTELPAVLMGDAQDQVSSRQCRGMHRRSEFTSEDKVVVQSSVGILLAGSWLGSRLSPTIPRRSNMPLSSRAIISVSSLLVFVISTPLLTTPSLHMTSLT